jgi:hypothetical protein
VDDDTLHVITFPVWLVLAADSVERDECGKVLRAIDRPAIHVAKDALGQKGLVALTDEDIAERFVKKVGPSNWVAFPVSTPADLRAILALMPKEQVPFVVFDPIPGDGAWWPVEVVMAAMERGPA